MKIEGYEEISEEEYNKLPREEGAYFRELDVDKTHYFKKTQKFPIVFEDEGRKIEIYSDSTIICNKRLATYISFHNNESLPLLVKAVEKAKEVMKKK